MAKPAGRRQERIRSIRNGAVRLRPTPASDADLTPTRYGNPAAGRGARPIPHGTTRPIEPYNGKRNDHGNPAAGRRTSPISHGTTRPIGPYNGKRNDHGKTRFTARIPRFFAAANSGRWRGVCGHVVVARHRRRRHHAPSPACHGERPASNLGSRILALVRRCLPIDWTGRYNVTPCSSRPSSKSRATPVPSIGHRAGSTWDHPGARALRPAYETSPAEKEHLDPTPPKRFGSTHSIGRVGGAQQCPRLPGPDRNGSFVDQGWMRMISRNRSRTRS